MLSSRRLCGCVCVVLSRLVDNVLWASCTIFSLQASPPALIEYNAEKNGGVSLILLSHIACLVQRNAHVCDTCPFPAVDGGSNIVELGNANDQVPLPVVDIGTAWWLLRRGATFVLQCAEACHQVLTFQFCPLDGPGPMSVFGGPGLSSETVVVTSNEMTLLVFFKVRTGVETVPWSGSCVY